MCSMDGMTVANLLHTVSHLEMIQFTALLMKIC